MSWPELSKGFAKIKVLTLFWYYDASSTYLLTVP